ncbi:alpha/beta hydrolase family protein [Phenylobacterium sp.]|uniref:alpha/beta hydrolase family protein n=1 Tax=Phenylobacterium sp. TaxID=1871053 RepID=UPI002FE2D087
MRALEILLLLTGLAALLGLAAPRLRRFGRPAALATAVVAAAHVLVEGGRWQMAPAYALAACLLAAALWRGRAVGRRTRRAGLALGGVGLVLALAASLAFPVFRFPAPEGPYAIGTVTYHWTDPARPDPFTPDPADRREVMVQVWYPARPADGPRARYVQDGAALAPIARVLGLPPFVTSHLSLVRTHAAEGAAAAALGPRPVLVFSHGRGGYRQHNTYMTEALVSRGYVVAAIEHPSAAAGVVFPDGRVTTMDPRMMDEGFVDRSVAVLAQDVRFVADRLAALDAGDPKGLLTGRLDLRRLGLFGVSLGGMTTAAACQQDPRFRACLILDAVVPPEVVEAGLRQPVMWISRDVATMRAEGWREADVLETDGSMRAAFAGLSGDGYLVLIPGVFHPGFADAPFLAATPVARSLGLVGPAEPRRAGRIMNAYALAFFDRHLNGAPAPLLDGPPAAWPEVIFESRRSR